MRCNIYRNPPPSLSTSLLSTSRRAHRSQVWPTTHWRPPWRVCRLCVQVRSAASLYLHETCYTLRSSQGCNAAVNAHTAYSFKCCCMYIVMLSCRPPSDSELLPLAKRSLEVLGFNLQTTFVWVLHLLSTITSAQPPSPSSHTTAPLSLFLLQDPITCLIECSASGPLKQLERNLNPFLISLQIQPPSPK